MSLALALGIPWGVPSHLMPAPHLSLRQGLFKGAGVLLKTGGVLFTYGVGTARLRILVQEHPAGCGVAMRVLGRVDGRAAAGMAEEWGVLGLESLSFLGHILSSGWDGFGCLRPGWEGSCPPSPQQKTGVGAPMVCDRTHCE